ncbi:MAG: adenylate/guanylate cyclase domain-containing protein, partial [Stellaceae bacterium]
MQCLACEHENRQQARFCEECGAALPVCCESCGRVNRPLAKFCDECGGRLGGPKEAAGPHATDAGGARAPQTYTPRYLAEKILTTRSALEGERKLVTVLFADIADSSALAQELEAEKLHLLMDRVLKLAADAVHRYEGTVNSYLGDGMMALFGAPIALEDHAVRAVHAALTIQETIRGYNSEIQNEHGVAVQLRIGLNTGSVVVGRIGDDLRMDYTANSNVVHLASRMQSLAEPGTIVITEDTYRAAAGEMRAEPLGPVEVRGQREPVVVYKVTARAPWRNRLEIRAEQGLTMLVGRQRELGQLHQRLTRAKAGRGQAVALVGEPGLGKSRLLYEFRRSLAGDRVNWLEGNCRAQGLTLPYGPILEILRLIFRLEEGDNPFQVAEKLRQGAGELDPALGEALPFLELLFGLPGEDA